MEYRLDEYVREDRQPGTWSSPLVWTILLLSGWVIYEATAQPALAVAAVCLKFGWGDFRTGWWLARRDPDRGRAAASSWLFLALGLWKSGLMAGFLMFTLPMAIPWQARGQQAAQPQGASFEAFMGAGIMVMACFNFSVLASSVAFYLGWRRRLKLWAGGKVHLARRRNLWPPTQVTLGGANWADALLVTTLVLYLAPLLIFAAVLAVSLVGGGGVRAPAVVLSVLPFVFGGPLLVLLLRDFFGRRLLARAPSECWGPAPDSQPSTMAAATS